MDGLLAAFENIAVNDHDALVNQFSSILNVDRSTAAFFLEAGEWDAARALNGFLESVGDVQNLGQMASANPTAAFLGDLSPLQAGEIFPGQTVNMNWTFQNSGSVPWPEDTKLVQTEGPNCGGPNGASIGRLMPGEVRSAAVSLCAPASDGNNVCCWQIVSNSAGPFGEPVWVIFPVSAPAPGVPGLQRQVTGGQGEAEAGGDSNMAT